MVQHYFKIALRNLSRQKALACINVFGLSAGIACFILFLLYAVNELHFDRFHLQAKNIYRVYEWSASRHGTGLESQTYLPMPLGPAMLRDLPDVKDYVRIINNGEETLLQTNRNVYRVKMVYADPHLFSVFSFPLKYGTADAALGEPNSLVLTESEAKRLFGTDDVVGKQVRLRVGDTFQPFRISAVAKDIPPNSSLRFDVLGNFLFAETSNQKTAVNNWNWNACQTFVRLLPNSRLPENSKQLSAFRRTYYPDEHTKKTIAGAHTREVMYGLQPLLSMHTDTRVNDGNSIEPKTIWILMGIAASVLLIACINFTTLAIGRSAGRSKEVGVRKVAGAKRKQLVFQFLSESLLLSVVATGIGFLLANLLLPYFNGLAGKQLRFSFALYPEMIWLLLGLMLLSGLLAGSYPAWILSAFNPVDVLKRKVRIGGSNFFTRSLVTLQFTLSIGLIISTIILLNQIRFMHDRNPGFNKDNVVMVDASETDAGKIFPLFKEELLKHPSVAAVTSTGTGFGEGEEYAMNVFKYKNRAAMAFFNAADPDYIDVMGMQMMAGRNFRADNPQDSTRSVIINEALMNELGWNLSDAVGQQLDGFMESRQAPIVIGVVKDFNFRPLIEKVMPQLFCPFWSRDRPKFLVRLNTGNPAPGLAVIEKTWNSLAPGIPVKYNFLDQKIDNYYRSEQRWSQIIGWAGGISIFLACLGLFGLTALAAVNRVKEIGIRKILGASVADIVMMMSKNFLVLMVIALLIASPLSWYFMDRWLEGFAYRVGISWTIFVAAGIVAIIAALLTISIEALKAAMANPVKSLRTE